MESEGKGEGRTERRGGDGEGKTEGRLQLSSHPFPPVGVFQKYAWAKFAGSVGYPMIKMLSASGGLRP